jgi:hypothetical protein
MVKALTSLVNPVRTAAPAGPVAGQMYFNSTDSTMYWYDGTAWVAAEGAWGPWVNFALGDGPDVPWGTTATNNLCQYRVTSDGKQVGFRMSKTSGSAYTVGVSGNYGNTTVGVPLPAAIIPKQDTPLFGVWDDRPVACWLFTADSPPNHLSGVISVAGGIPSITYGAATLLTISATWFAT